jgi:uncharacterized protein (DUF697 family)
VARVASSKSRAAPPRQKKPDDAKGRALLTSVERLVASSAKLRAVAAEVRAIVKATKPDEPVIEAAGQEVVRRYSNRAAIVGGASGLPALIPGVGLAIGLGAILAELAALLKVEVEMTLVLLDLYDFDIDDPKERQLGFLLASVGTYDAGTGSNFLVDVARAEGVAIWNYAPRRAARMLVTVMAYLVAVRLWRGLVKLVPFLGIAVGSSMNKVLTMRVGERARRALATRRELIEKNPRSRSGERQRGKSRDR